jgi:hypothetical protein
MAYIFITRKEKTNWKYILIIVILALIVAGETLYLARQEVKIPEIKLPQKPKEETANWKTYRNEEYGFEMKCPGEWKVEFTEDSQVLLTCSIESEFDEERKILLVDQLSVRINFPQEWSVEPIGDGKEIVIRSIKFRPVIFPWNSGYVIMGGFCGGQKFEQLNPYVPSCEHSSHYQFFLFCHRKKWKDMTECDSFFNQMLSTFRFLE